MITVSEILRRTKNGGDMEAGGQVDKETRGRRDKGYIGVGFPPTKVGPPAIVLLHGHFAGGLTSVRTNRSWCHFCLKALPLRRDKGTRRFIPLLLAVLIFGSYNRSACGAAEHERQDMSQRARAALEEILSTEEFRDQRSQPPWWLRLTERLLDHLPGGTRWMGTVLEWLFYLIAALVTISAFVFVARRFRRLPSFTTAGPRVPMEPQLNMDPGAARERAYECSQRGDYRQAIRYLYLSFLLHLDKAGLFTYDAGKTNGEILKEVYGSMGNAAELFAFLTLSFERKWYGMEESTVADFRQCEEAVHRLISS